MYIRTNIDWLIGVNLFETGEMARGHDDYIIR